MTEKEYRLDCFKERCGWMNGKRVFIYGTGANALALLERYGSEFSFGAVIYPGDEKPEDFPECPGRPLIALQEAFSLKPDIILIAAQMFAAEAIFGRIGAACRARGIGVFDLYGTDLTALHCEIAAQPFLDLSGWRRETSGYDVVALELLDTVLVRDMLQSRKPVVRPVMKHLIPELWAGGKEIIYIGYKDQDPEWYRQALVENGLLGAAGRFLMFDDTERFFRRLREERPGKSMLCIGSRVPESCVIPRICGLDTYHFVFADTSVLTGFDKVRAQEDGQLSAEELRTAIDSADTVLFDLFDTLLVRKTSCPEDVFAMAAYRSADLCTDEERRAYYRSRCAAQKLCAAADAPDPELSCEAEVLSVRDGAWELLEYAVSRGKLTAIVTDTDRSEAELRRFIKGCGRESGVRIFASSEYGLSKKEGLIGLALEELGADPDTALFIGDSEERDALPSERAGAAYKKLPSVRELAGKTGAELSGPSEELPGRAELAARLLQGMWAQRCFEEPFGPSAEGALKRYGSAALAPLMICWDLWLLAKAREHGAERILFASRDGWLPLKIYRLLGLEEQCRASYFYTSRHSAFLLSSGAERTAGYIADMADGMEPGEVLRRFYGIERPEYVPGPSPDKQELARLIEENAAEAEKVSAEARASAEKYWKKEGLAEGLEYIYADFVASGTSQRLLEEAAPFKLHGCYLGRPVSGLAPACEAESMISAVSGRDTAFLERYLEMEYYMTSPEPSLSCFSANGEPVFDRDVRTRQELEEIAAVHEAAVSFAEEFIKLSGWDRLSGDEKALAGSLMLQNRPSAMALAASSSAPERKYFDDWSRRWIDG